MLEVESATVKRLPLSRDRVFAAAVKIADVNGLAALTMRSLAQELGVKPMSLYYYVRNKEEILDGIVDSVFAEIELPEIGQEWRAEMRGRARSAREVLGRHPWALALMETRTNPGPETLRHQDAMLGTLRAAGFSLPLTAHAYAIIDAYVTDSLCRRHRCRSRVLRAPARWPVRSCSASPLTTTHISSSSRRNTY